MDTNATVRFIGGPRGPKGQDPVKKVSTTHLSPPYMIWFHMVTYVVMLHAHPIHTTPTSHEGWSSTPSNIDSTVKIDKRNDVEAGAPSPTGHGVLRTMFGVREGRVRGNVRPPWRLSCRQIRSWRRGHKRGWGRGGRGRADPTWRSTQFRHHTYTERKRKNYRLWGPRKVGGAEGSNQGEMTAGWVQVRQQTGDRTLTAACWRWY